MREKLNYPPFCDIIVFVVSGLNEELVKSSIYELYKNLKKEFNTYNPAPAPISKINGEYRWRILIKEKMDDEKNANLGKYIETFLTENEKNDLKLNVDVNPNNMM